MRQNLGLFRKIRLFNAHRIVKETAGKHENLYMQYYEIKKRKD